jgi:hypothetical protein
MTRWGFTALHQSIRRDNDITIIKDILDYRGDFAVITKSLDFKSVPMTGWSMAARRGRGDILALLESRGLSLDLSGIDLLLAHCAKHEEPSARLLLQQQPHLIRELTDSAGTFLGEFAGVGNTAGVELLMVLGVPVNSLYPNGDGYFDIAPQSTALHIGAWRARHSTVKALITHGADLNSMDAFGRTPIELAVKACVNSYWTRLRSPESVRALVGAGVSLTPVAKMIPCGYPEVDQILLPLLGRG